MEKIFIKVVSISIILFGVFLIIRPNLIANKLKSFYSKYPIVRYAGEKQLSSRPQFIIVTGIVFVILGLICFFVI